MCPTTARWAAPQPTPLDPQPAQLRRGHRSRPHTITVADPSAWASSACTATTEDQRGAAIADYAVRIAGRPDLLAQARAGLAGKDLGCYCPTGLPCHRDVLIDIAQPAEDPYAPGGHTLGVTVARPWASLTLLPDALCPTTIHHRSWCTDYRGVLCIMGSHRLDEDGVAAAAIAGFDARWHGSQTGWLGAAVLVDVHRAARYCCPPFGRRQRRRDQPLYHWVFRHGARLARPVFGRGFPGVRPVSWTVLVRPAELGFGRASAPHPHSASRPGGQP
jgi:hypothetical protein